ncbi:UDP-N-acetylglucosamine pyrophosphorylase [Vanrija albida]|uniref:UDP-N-acetylglucosamine diphosphorylase n=1 Tax=Vanrija albida TaxID=181172 RepID=A0ABR3PYK9_9TREE
MTLANDTINVSALKATYDEAGQGHVFKFWDKLAPAEQAQFAEQLSSIDVNRVNRIYRNAVAAEAPVTPLVETPQEVPGDGLQPPHLLSLDKSRSPSPAPGVPEPVLPLPESACATVVNNPEDEARWRAIGLDAIANNQVAVLLMAGGQGTRLGSSHPKGMYDISLPSHKTLFEYQASRIGRLEAVAAAAAGKDVNDVKIRWYVMTSGPTRKETEAYFESQNWFGLGQESVIFFEQGVLPALSNEGKLLLATPSSLFVAPDGNGGLYSALRKPLAPGSDLTVLSDLSARGIQYVHAYCVDNCLVKVADPVFIGSSIERQATCGAKVVRKHLPTESVGVLAQKGGAFSVVEYSELSREKAEQLDETGRLAFWAGNIANHFYTTDFLHTIEAMERKMAFHIARKKIAHVDIATGETIKPTEPNGMKLELFVFDVFPFTSSLSVLEVDRAEEFSPLKNAPGSKADSPETSRRDLLAQQRRWLEAAGATVAEDAEVEVTPTVTYGGEGLEFVAGKHIVRSGVISSAADLDALL